LNRLRRGAERWTDLLLAQLYESFDVEEFAFVPDRAEEFAGDLRHEERLGGGLAWQLVLSSLRSAFQRTAASPSPNGDLNERIASGVLRCFESRMFDSTGLTKSLWMVRMENAAADTEGMIAELMDEGLADAGRFRSP
jgi:hypothetical protein